MTLDQTLRELEPILCSTDGTFQFTHPSFQEVLTARQFTDEINSGRLSVRDSYDSFYLFFNRPNICLDNTKTLTYIAQMLETDKLEELVNLFCDNTDEKITNSRWVLQYRWRIFPPYKVKDIICIEETVCFHTTAFQLAKQNQTLKEKLGKKYMGDFIKSINKEKPEFYKLYFLWYVADLNYYDDRLIDLLGHPEDVVKLSIVDSLERMRHYHPKLLTLLNDKHPLVRARVLEALGRISHYDTKIVDLLADKDEYVRGSARFALLLFGLNKEKSTVNILEDIKEMYEYEIKGDFVESLKELDRSLQLTRRVPLGQHSEYFLRDSYIHEMKEKNPWVRIP